MNLKGDTGNKDSTTIRDGQYTEMDTGFRPVSVIADRVYASCQERESFEKVTVPIPDEGYFDFANITFSPGKIIDGTLMVTPIHNRPNFSRVQYELAVQFTVKLRNTATGVIKKVHGELPVIKRDIVLYIPKARDEFKFNIIVETAAKVLADPYIEKHNMIFTVGVFIITKVLGKVQLYIPEYRFCPEPADCEEFLHHDVCEEFEMEPFPEFFPPKLESDEKDDFL